ncbi:MAG TPA: CCA tRNA nucleotidyltransferase [Aestuariivirgaceae bacterium]|jgi:poly(A) polymerase
MKKHVAVPRLPRIRQAWLRQPALRKVLEVLNREGTTRIAGGAVRNALLGGAVTEIDLASTLTPQEVTRTAQSAGLTVHPTGLEHGTVMVVAEGTPFEVTTLRVDVETFGRRARVSFTDNWEADASRRDFTMNALYCDLNGQVHDPLGGYHDLRRHVVKFVGNPEARIEEDHLRILRFFRFTAQYGSGAPDSRGLEHCVRLRRNLKSLSAERVRQELWKLLSAPGALRMLRVMEKKGINRILLGRPLNLKAFEYMVAADRALKLAPDPLLRLHILTGSATEYRDILKLTNAEMDRLRALGPAGSVSPQLRPHERKIVLYQFGRQTYLDGVRCAWALSAVPKDPRWRRLLRFERRASLPKFPVTGADLKALGIEAGPTMGAMLKALEDWWMASGFPDDKHVILKRLEALRRLPSSASFGHKQPLKTEQGAED